MFGRLLLFSDFASNMLRESFSYIFGLTLSFFTLSLRQQHLYIFVILIIALFQRVPFSCAVLSILLRTVLTQPLSSIRMIRGQRARILGLLKMNG